VEAPLARHDNLLDLLHEEDEEQQHGDSDDDDHRRPPFEWVTSAVPDHAPTAQPLVVRAR
jgi:hypothetical protein